MFTEEGIPKSAHQQRLENIYRKSIISRALSTAADRSTVQYNYDATGQLVSITPVQTEHTS